MSDATATDAPAPKTTVSITVDGAPHEAAPGQLVIDACEDAGVYIPRFCYHPRMAPVGMCRQCLVEVEGPRGPMMVVSCMTPVAEGQVVRTTTPAVRKAQEGVLEFLLANHPLDCPVCDKGGECPLQDQAYTHGPGESRFVEEKRHYEKPIAISELVLLDRERCVLCDRCTRFAKEVAGDPLIHFTSRGNTTQVLTFPDQPFRSYFSGNTVQICPVGALLAKPYRFKARPWDLEQVESTCTTCSVGCRIVVQSSRNQLLRYQGVDADAVNWGWLCDKGRFSFQAANDDARLRAPLVRTDGALTETTWAAGLDAAARALRDALAPDGGGVAVLGGARGTNEDAYAWARLAADVLGGAPTDPQLADGLPAEVVLDLPRATIDDAAAAPTVLLLGPDLKEELPVLYLRIRDAAEKRRTRLIEVSPVATGLTPYTYRSVRSRPGEQPAAVRTVLAEEAEQLARGPVVVVVGRQNLAESADGAVVAIAAVREALPDARFLPALRRGNVLGALLAGLAPAPGGPGAREILESAAAGRLGCLVLLGADPVADCPDRDLARRALAGARRVIALDAFLTESSRQADVVLAVAMAGEKSGSTTNLEGRVSLVGQKVTPVGTARPDWMIAVELAYRLGTDLGLDSVEHIQQLMAESLPAFAGIDATSVRANHTEGLLARIGSADWTAPATPAVPPQGGYEFRLVTSRKLYDDGVILEHSPDLAPLAPGARLHLHPVDAERFPATVRVSSARGAVALAVSADPGVPRGVAWVPFNQPDVAVNDLVELGAVVTDVRVESLP